MDDDGSWVSKLARRDHEGAVEAMSEEDENSPSPSCGEVDVPPDSGWSLDFVRSMMSSSQFTPPLPTWELSDVTLMGHNITKTV